MAKGHVKWYGDDVLARVQAATAEMVDKAVFMIEGQAKVNIVDNGQVDTGFMLNSTYGISSKSNSYSPGTAPDRQAAPPARPASDRGGVVGVAAHYAIYRETDRSFLYRAVEQVASSGAVEIVQAGRREMT